MLLILLVTACLHHGGVAHAETTDYMTDKCGSIVRTDSWRRLESTPTLTYPPNVDCSYTVTTPPGSRVMVLVRRFQLEHPVSGNCLDFVNFHDGIDLNAAKLNPAPLCGTLPPPSNYSSSAESLTVAFSTDSTAQDKGFDLTFVSFTTGPCTGDQFQCDDHKCIGSSLACDHYDQCSDRSDETSCPDTSTVVPNSVDVGLIAGLCVGLAVAIATAIVAFLVYRHFKWRRFLLDSELLADVTIKDPEPTYPVTWKYWNEPIIVGKSEHVFKWGVRGQNDGKHIEPTDNPTIDQ